MKAAAPGGKRWSRIVVRACAMLLAIAAAVLVLEVVLPEPPGLRGAIWRQARGSIEEYAPGKLRPLAHFVGVQTVGGGVQRIRHNALGMRGPELEQKQRGERRVLFLGDSVTYGTGVQEEQTFAFQVASLLTKQRGTTVSSGIAACPGFGIRDQVDLLRRVGGALAPDLIVSCVFVENDLYDDLQVERGVFAGYPVFQASHVHLLRRSFRARLAVRSNVAYQLEQLLLQFAPALAMDLHGVALTKDEIALWQGIAPDQSVLFLEQAQSTPAIDRLCARARAALSDLRQAAGVTRLALVLIPSYVQYVPGLFEHLAASRTAETGHARGAIQARLHAIGAELDLPVFDLLPHLVNRRDIAELLIPNDYHFTPAGHTVVAQALTPWLNSLLSN